MLKFEPTRKWYLWASFRKKKWLWNVSWEIEEIVHRSPYLQEISQWLQGWKWIELNVSEVNCRRLWSIRGFLGSNDEFFVLKWRGLVVKTHCNYLLILSVTVLTEKFDETGFSGNNGINTYFFRLWRWNAVVGMTEAVKFAGWARLVDGRGRRW